MNAPSTPELSVVIAARDAAGTLGAVLDDLIATRPGNRVEVIVVDDGSNDDTVGVAVSRAAGIPLLQVVAGEGRGPAAARNLGVRRATAAWLAFIDADVRLAPRWLDAGLRATNGDADVVEGIVRPSGGDSFGLLRHWAASEGDGRFVTANLWVRRRAFESVGGFDERYTVPWREDTDLGWRLLDGGARVVTDTDVVALHPYYRRPLGALFREGQRVEADTRLRRNFPERARALQPRRERRRSYVATVTLLSALGLAGAGAGTAAGATAVAAEALAVWAILPIAAYRGTTTLGEWLVFGALAPVLVVARTWWITASNVRYRTWFW